MTLVMEDRNAVRELLSQREQVNRMATEREERQMRILKITSGLAVLVITSGFERHLLRHMFVEVSRDAKHSPAVLAGITAILVVGAFSFIGGCLLLVGDR
jgi:hypothetical protein